jgi:hypothetical protein
MLPPGAYRFGPRDGTLTVRTGKTGAASKAGHNLVIEVTSWCAHLVAGEHMAIVVDADADSLKVRDGSGGMQALGDDDMANIESTIDDEVLKGGTIAFRSTAVEANGSALRVHGELDLLGVRRPLAFDLTTADGHVMGSARFKQTDWGMTPYSTLFGTLKVADEVEVCVDVTPK